MFHSQGLTDIQRLSRQYKTLALATDGLTPIAPICRSRKHKHPHTLPFHPLQASHSCRTRPGNSMAASCGIKSTTATQIVSIQLYISSILTQHFIQTGILSVTLQPGYEIKARPGAMVTMQGSVKIRGNVRHSNQLAPLTHSRRTTIWISLNFPSKKRSLVTNCRSPYSLGQAKYCSLQIFGETSSRSRSRQTRGSLGSLAKGAILLLQEELRGPPDPKA